MFIGLVGFDGQTISPLLVAHYWKSCKNPYIFEKKYKQLLLI